MLACSRSRRARCRPLGHTARGKLMQASPGFSMASGMEWPARVASCSPVDSFVTLMKEWETSTVFPVFFRVKDVIDPRNLAPEVFLRRALALGVGPELVRRLSSAIVARGVHDPVSWARDYQIPKRLIEVIGNLPRLELEHSVVSGTDGFQKLRFRTHDRLAIETVIIPLHKPGAISICLSSQVGCVMGCQFCATARMPSRRSLETWEIIDQFIQARQLARKHGTPRHGCGVHGHGRTVPELRACAGGR